MLLNVLFATSIMINILFLSIMLTSILYGFRLIVKNKQIDFVWNGYANRERTKTMK